MAQNDQEFDEVTRYQQEEHEKQFQEVQTPEVDPDADPGPASEMQSELPASNPAPAGEVETGKEFQIDHMADATELNLSAEALMTKRKLAKEPKMPFFIPFDQGESKGATRTATINGYPFTIMKGQYVNLPQTVVKLLMQSMNMEAAALNDNPFNMANPDSVNNPGFRKDAAI